MGFFRKLLGLEEEEVSEEIREARRRHGIEVNDADQAGIGPDSSSGLDKEEEYDPWEEVRNMRTNFFLGSWATRRYRRIFHNEDKLRADLEKVAREREEKERRKAGKENQ